jgi:predicted transcriptional regulator
MTQPMPATEIQYGRERLLIARLILALMRHVNAAFFPGLRLAEAIELAHISISVMIGHLEKRPFTLTKLSRGLGYPRATMLRKLARLIELGLVERVGRYYYAGKNANRPRQREIVMRNKRMIKETYKELSKLGPLPCPK